MSRRTFQRRARRARSSVLLDEAVALVQSDPLRWVSGAALPALPLVAISLLFVHMHREVWIDDAWSGWVIAGSAALSVGVVLAFQLRAIGHGLVARRVVRALHPAALENAPERLPWLSLICVGTVGAAFTLVGFASAVLPGLALAGFCVPLPAIVAVEGRDAGAAVARARKLPRGTAGKGLGSSVLFGGLVLVAWIDIVAGTQVGLLVLRALTGADVTVLSRLFGLGNEAFVLGSLVVAMLVVEPLWAIQRALVYLDARLGQSGTDLLERWRTLSEEPSQRPLAKSGGAASGAVLTVVLLAAMLPGPARAQVQPDGYADDLGYWREQLEDALDRYGTSGFEDLSSIKSSLQYDSARELQLPSGALLSFDAALLGEGLPDWIHTDETERQARRVVRLLHRAEDTCRRMADPSLPPLEEPVDARTLLEEELADASYDTSVRDEAGQEYREGLQQSFRTWWEGVIRKLTWSRPAPASTGPPPVLPAFDGRIVMAAVAVILAVLILVFLLSQSAALKGRVPDLDANALGGGGALPDARQRTPLGWRDHADELAAEGLYREAVRALFLAALARLDRTREIDYRPERTNGEHLRSFTGSEARQERFVDATWRFEVAWYGGESVTVEDYEAMTEATRPLVRGDTIDAGGVSAVLPGAVRG